MLNPEELSDEVFSAIQNYYVVDDDHIDQLVKQVSIMSPEEAFDIFLKWHGIINYTDMILRAWHSIESAEVKPKASSEELHDLFLAEERDRQRRIEARIESSQRRDEIPGDSRNPDWTEE